MNGRGGGGGGGLQKRETKGLCLQGLGGRVAVFSAKKREKYFAMKGATFR